jgi:hypothetical protein
MMERMNSRNTSLEIYHGVPEGWSKEEIISTHKSLNGSHNIEGPNATEPGAPSWLPDRYNWLQYRETLRRVAEGVLEGDLACIEIAIRYIELNYFGSYSGFIRERLARCLKNQELTNSQIERLKTHFQKLIDIKMCFDEFREYKKLRQRLVNG